MVTARARVHVRSLLNPQQFDLLLQEEILHLGLLPLHLPLQIRARVPRFLRSFSYFAQTKHKFHT